jgi:hypothetical protein
MARSGGGPSAIKLSLILWNGQLFVNALEVNPYASAFWESLALLLAHLDELEQELDHRPEISCSGVAGFCSGSYRIPFLENHKKII